jgi:hypothetical protein
MDIYSLSRNFWDYAFENPEKISPNHAAIYFFAIEHCNRLGWKQKFGFPSQMTMDAIGIKKHQTYIRYFEDLCEWGFFNLIQKSKNQYSANIISLKTAMPKNGKALDKAIIKHTAKQTQSNGQSNSSIDIPIYQDTNIPIDNNTKLLTFELFWELYDKKVDSKKCKDKFEKVKESDRQKILETLPLYVKSTPDKQYRKNPITYLNNESWNDTIVITESKSEPINRLKVNDYPPGYVHKTNMQRMEEYLLETQEANKLKELKMQNNEPQY